MAPLHTHIYIVSRHGFNIVARSRYRLPCHWLQLELGQARDCGDALPQNIETATLPIIAALGWPYSFRCKSTRDRVPCMCTIVTHRHLSLRQHTGPSVDQLTDTSRGIQHLHRQPTQVSWSMGAPVAAQHSAGFPPRGCQDRRSGDACSRP